MIRHLLVPVALLTAVVAGVAVPAAQQPDAGPYRVLQSEKVGGEGGWDYLFADTNARRLYIPRRGTASVPARVTVFNLDTLAPVGHIDGITGAGVVVDPTSGHGFTSSRPVAMFDAPTLTPIRTIDVGGAQPDGLLLDAFNGRVYMFSHPTKDATVIDAKDGAIVGTIDLGGTPEQGAADGAGMLYVVMQDQPGSVTAVDVRTMKAVSHFPLGNAGGCNGLALDVAHGVLFAACARAGAPDANRAQPTAVVLNASDGHILATLPLAGGSDGAAFNPATQEFLSTQGNGTLSVVRETSPTTFEVEQNLSTMNGARTIALDRTTGHVFTASVERGAAPPPPADGGRPTPAPVVPGSFTILMVGR
jgi:DNA-binding beta-propeller fold protein YncE